MKITVPTGAKRQVIDITKQVEDVILAGSNSSAGICAVSVLHTTAAISCADLDPGTDLDMLDAFELMVPKLAYRHPHDPSHAPDHIISALIGPSVVIPYSGGRLVLGAWQRIVLFEFDGPRDREIAVTLVESG